MKIPLVISYSVKIFARFWLVKTTRIVHHNHNTRHKSWNTCAIFPSPMLIWDCSHLSALKYAWLNIGEGEGHIWLRTKVWRVNVTNSEKIQDKWLPFQRFVTSIAAAVDQVWKEFCQIEPMTSKWRQKCNLVAGYWAVDRENLGTRLSCFGSYNTMAELSRNILLFPRRNIVWNHRKNSKKTTPRTTTVIWSKFADLSRTVTRFCACAATWFLFSRDWLLVKKSSSIDPETPEKAIISVFKNCLVHLGSFKRHILYFCAIIIEKTRSHWGEPYEAKFVVVNAPTNGSNVAFNVVIWL